MRITYVIALSLAFAAKTFAVQSVLEHQLPTKSSSDISQVLKARSAGLKKSSSLEQCPDVPSQVQLGMNGTPVLNQGAFVGAQSVFAATAAIDAALGKGDYVSQLCLLQLGNYMATNAHSISGWDGTFLPMEWKRLDNYGFVNKEQQKANGCGGLTEYPQTDDLPSTSINYDDYHQMSEGLLEHGMLWSPLLDFNKAIDERTDTAKTLHDIKKSLAHGHRVTSMFLVIGSESELGTPNAIGKHNVNDDTWTLSVSMQRQLTIRPELYGLTALITGFDDEAIAVDEMGKQHTGLLTLRGSWGTSVGDHGEFYMTYDYFRVLVLDAQKLIAFTETEENK